METSTPPLTQDTHPLSSKCKIPNMDCNKENFILLSGLAQMSVMLSAEATKHRVIDPLAMHSQIKW